MKGGDERVLMRSSRETRIRLVARDWRMWSIHQHD